MDPACSLLKHRERSSNIRVPSGFDNIVDAYMEEPYPSTIQEEAPTRSYEPSRAYAQDVRDNGQNYEVIDRPYRVATKTSPKPLPPFTDGYKIQGYALGDSYADDSLEYGRMFQEDNMFHASESMFKDRGNTKINSRRSLSPNEYYEEEDTYLTTQENQDRALPQEESPVSPPITYHRAPQQEQEVYIPRRVNESGTPTGRMYLDLTAYVVSGILLIYMMEQILQLGIYLGAQ